MLGLLSRLDKMGVVEAGLKDLHVEVDTRLFGGNISVASNHCRLTMST